MEQKNQKKNVSEPVKENSRANNDWLSNASSAAVETYKKQMNMAFTFYNDMFNTAINAGRTNWGVNQNFMDAFTNQGKSNPLFTPFPWMKLDIAAINPFINSSENFVRQLMDYNQNWFANLQNYFHLKQQDMISLNEKYQDFLDEQLKNLKKAADIVDRAYNRQQDLSADMNKELLTEFNDQTSKIVKATEEFWNNVARVFEAAGKDDRAQKTTKDAFHPAEV
jgi:hypothetical protein